MNFFLSINNLFGVILKQKHGCITYVANDSFKFLPQGTTFSNSNFIFFALICNG